MSRERVKSKKIKVGMQDKTLTIVINAIAVLMILAIVYPLWFVVIASFSNPADVANGEVWFWPKKWIIDGYKELFKQAAIWRSYGNTIFYTLAGTFIALAINIPAGFAMSRKDMVGRKWINIFYIVPMFISGGLIPTYLVVQQFNLLDTIWVMMVPFCVSIYNIIVARTFFNTSMPEGLWEAAQIDGCGTIHYFFKFALPLSKAILAVIGLWTAVGIWNSWFNALIYIQDETLQPLQLFLRRILISNQSLLGAATGDMAAELRRLSDMMKYASIVISTIPIMCLYPFLQKHFNQGVMIGAIKE
jgi:putative aldouronate transport system permease protein